MSPQLTAPICWWIFFFSLSLSQHISRGRERKRKTWAVRFFRVKVFFILFSFQSDAALNFWWLMVLRGDEVWKCLGLRLWQKLLKSCSQSQISSKIRWKAHKWEATWLHASMRAALECFISSDYWEMCIFCDWKCKTCANYVRRAEGFEENV